MSITEPCQDGVTHAASPTDAGQAPVCSDVAAQSDESQSYSNNILLWENWQAARQMITVEPREAKSGTGVPWKQ